MIRNSHTPESALQNNSLLLSPGQYQLLFSALGFKIATVLKLTDLIGRKVLLFYGGSKGPISQIMAAQIESVMMIEKDSGILLCMMFRHSGSESMHASLHVSVDRENWKTKHFYSSPTAFGGGGRMTLLAIDFQ